MFTLETLAAELGIDPATLQAKPEVAAKWNGYLTKADSQYTSAAQMRTEAEAQLAAVKAEQTAIDEKITSFGMTEAELSTLRANYAALEAQAKALQAQGFKLTVPDMPKGPTPKEFNAQEFANTFAVNMGHALTLSNKSIELFGKPITEDWNQLSNEAVHARMSLNDYVSQKYKFGEAEQKKTAEATAKRDAEIATAAVKKYQEEHPITAGHPDLARGVASRHPQIVRQRDSTPKNFANMSARDKIAQSVSRTRTAITTATS